MEGILILIGFAALRMRAVTSPGPSFLVVARTAGIGSALGLGMLA